MRGPKASAFTWTGNTVRVSITHRNGTDFTPATGILYFTGSDDNGALTFTVARSTASEIIATADRAIVGTLNLDYLGGGNPGTGAQVFDNGSTPLPMHAETELLTNAGAVPTYSTVSQTLRFAYSVAAAAVEPPRQYYTVSQTLGFAYNIAAATGGAMSFTPSAARTVTVQATSRAFTAGDFWNMSDPKKPRGIKDPNSTTDFSVDWSPWLADIGNPAIATHEFTLDGGLSRVASVANGSICTLFASGGVPKQASFTCRITTATTPPRVEDRTVYLEIEDR